MSILSPEHLSMLHDGSGISDAVIAARGYKTITDAAELPALGFSAAQCRAPGLLLPLHTTDGGNNLYIYRPDNPRVIENRQKKNRDGTHPQKVIKYELPKGESVRLDCPPTCRPALADPKVPLWITEGQKKADALASHNLCAVALLGVWNFKGRNENGGTTFLADFDYIGLDGRDVRIVFDSDVMQKPQVRQALNRLTNHLQRKKATVTAVYLPPGPAGKVGVDDYLAAGHTVAELEALIESPRPETRAAQPVVELLDALPATMNRPLALVDGVAYAATWLPVRVTKTEVEDKHGNIIRLTKPITTNERRLFILCDNGRLFGEGGDESLEALGIDVHLPEVPPADRLLSLAGVKAYRAGQKPDPANVFARVVDTVDRFIDFSKSLAGQRVMAELIGCYILASWFLDAFNVIGFLWPNGDRGSGKTQLLTVICEQAYLGQVILSGGSFASLRDLADYGAVLAFDDAEGLSDARRADPDKRALLLAGNRRGNTVPIKEPTSDRTWRTRHVNTFCPRLFSAIRLPDPVLASRTIIVPLIRTPERYRANSDPLEYNLWPHDRRTLIDDLWMLALSRLPELPTYEAEVNQKATLTGRNLEPWRALLAVALWLDRNGALGLWERMEGLSVSYQNERAEIEIDDLAVLVIRGLCHCAISAISAVAKEGWTFSVNEIAEAVSLFDDDAPESNPSPSDSDAARERRKYIRSLSRRTGRVLQRMRLRQAPRPGGKGSRLWQVTPNDLDRWASVYSIDLPEELKKMTYSYTPISNGTNGTVGTMAQENAEHEVFEL